MGVFTAEAAYAADPAAIAAVGTEAWSANFCLPATGAEFEVITDAVLARYHAIAADLAQDRDSRLAQVWSLAQPMIFTIARIVHAELAAGRLQEQHRPCRLGHNSIQPEVLVERAVTELDWLGRTTFNRSMAVRTRVRLFAVGINAGVRGVLSPAGIAYSVLRPRFRMLRQHAAERGLHDRPVILRPVPPTKPENTLLVDAALSCLTRGGAAVGVSRVHPNVREAVSRFFRQIEAAFDAAAEIARGRARRPLLIASIRSMSDRAMAVAWRSAGGEVVCFSHGNIHATAYRRGALTDGSASFASRYVAGSRMEETISKAAVRDFGIGEGPEIVALERNIYSGSNIAPAIRNTTVRRIMLMGSPLNGRFYPYTAGTNAFSALDLELRLCRLLKQKKFYLIYKAHPETLLETRGMFDGHVDVVETGRFEQLGPVADCLMFPNWYSSTFGHALMGDRPIVLLRDLALPILRETEDAIANRCAVVNTTQDEKGRVLFDATDLLAAVDAAPGKKALPDAWWT